MFVDFLARFAEVEIDGRNVGLDAVQADVALALLLGIVEGMSVEKGPDELAADVFEAEFEMWRAGKTVWWPLLNVAAPMLRRCLSVISSGVMRWSA